jgi:hypothetical protein
VKALRLAGLVAIGAAGGSLGATEAIQSLVGATGPGVVADGGAGFAFRPSTNLYISALGYFFSTNFASLASAVVELQDAHGVVRAVVALTNSPPQSDDWSYQSVPAFFVPAGATNYLVAYDPVEYAANHTKAWTGAYVEAVNPSSMWFQAAPDLLYLGPTSGTNVTDDPWFYFIGPNFRFTDTPTPPALGMSLTPTNTLVLFWPTQAAAFSLQATTNLRAWPGTSLGIQPMVEGTNNVVLWPGSQPSTYFRLIQ